MGREKVSNTLDATTVKSAYSPLTAKPISGAA
jgi:hypothetical protein